MSSKLIAIAVATIGMAVISTSAWAFGGVGGCSDLPEYYRALGALQGGMESACAMSVAQARQILSAYGGVPGEQRVIAPRDHRRRARPTRSPSP